MGDMRWGSNGEGAQEISGENLNGPRASGMYRKENVPAKK
jgi:hypothetical protein